MSKIFISYRRQDSAQDADKIYKSLVKAFGKENIFFDIDKIPPGTDFRVVLENTLRESKVVLVLIGSQWADIKDNDGQLRLHNPADFVRLEAETALVSLKTVTIPVLLHGTSMPSPDDLPDSLRDLCYRNAIKLDESTWDHDIDKMLRSLNHYTETSHNSRGLFGWLSSFQKSKKNSINAYPVTCPNCITTMIPDKDRRCSACHFEIPNAYIANTQLTTPLFFETMGWSASGKSVFLQALRLQLLNMVRVWHGFSVQSLTKEDMQTNLQARSRLLPEASPLQNEMKDNQQILQLNKIPRYGNKTIVTHDLSGDLFEDFIPDEFASRLLGENVFNILTFSIPDQINTDRPEYTFDRLVNTLVEAYLKKVDQGALFTPNIIVVLTKADVIRDLMPELRDYLIGDPLQKIILENNQQANLDSGKLQKYVENLEFGNELIKDWLRSDSIPGTANGINLMEQYDFNIRYSIISGLGSNAYQQQDTLITPYRVADPFFWMLELDRRARLGNSK